MSPVDRRRFLQSIAAALPAGALAGCVGRPGPASLDGETLGVVAESVLPAELGPEGVQRAVAGFRRWLAEYQPVTELNHGYGTGDLEYTSAHPGPGWAAQLEALDLEARQRHGVRLAELDLERRTDLLRSVIARERVERLGDPAQARHVAVGLLAFFYGTPEANDLCYRATIGQYACRPLEQASDRPRPVAGS